MKVMLQKSAEKHLTPEVSPGRFCHQIMYIICTLYIAGIPYIYIHTVYIYIYVLSIYIKKNLLNIHNIINCLAGFLLLTMRRNQPLCDFIVFPFCQVKTPQKKS